MTAMKTIAIAGLVLLVGASHAFVPSVPRRSHPSRPSWSSWSSQLRVQSPSSTRSSSSLWTATAANSAVLPRISQRHLDDLDRSGYVIIDDFLPPHLQQELRSDVQNLRAASKFKTAKIGQDSTNALNTQIRVAETCFLGTDKLGDVPDASRSTLYDILDRVRQDLPKTLDRNLSELLYAYYPSGGFYRRHRDAIPGSASTLREYSLLLYLNEDWQEKDGGRLRMHFDSGGDALPEGEQPNFSDVDPLGGTLVLFQSDKIPHEVLDTNAERVAVIGWYNRPVSAGDIAALSADGGGGDSIRVVALAVALGLITVGVLNILN